jgi:UDP-N-acetylglucosamine--N-acetylmuramyl-(pentapeptide) pyrophosphoryl-undecaprenol N-acetylglucosamine transferase
VPLPGADEQRRNAEVLANAGAARIIPQDDLTPQRLHDEIFELLDTPCRLSTMRNAAAVLQSGQPAEQLVDELLTLAAQAHRGFARTRSNVVEGST